MEEIKRALKNSKIFKDLPDDAIDYLSEGDFIGEMALIEESERSATCKAEEDTELLLFTKRAFDEIMENNPKIACIILREITRVLSHRLRETTEKIV